MATFMANGMVRRIAASLGVLGSLALAYYYLLFPALTVPPPATYGFVAAWFVLVGLSLKWWSKQPWRSFAVPIVGLIAVLPVLWLGTTYLGWAP